MPGAAAAVRHTTGVCKTVDSDLETRDVIGDECL